MTAPSSLDHYRLPGRSGLRVSRMPSRIEGDVMSSIHVTERLPTKRIPGIVFCALVVCFAMSASSVALAQTAPTQEAPIEPNKAIVAAAFDRWAAGGSDFFKEMLTTDIVWTIEGSGPSAGTYRGYDEFMARAVRPFVSRLREPVRPVSKKIWADGDHVIINWEGQAVARDGRPYRNRYVWIFRMHGGKAAEVNAFLDLTPYDDVIRRIPAPEGEGAQ